MDFELQRDMWFQNEQGMNLRYIQFDPPKECKEHRQCNCTQIVAERPEGEPLAINTYCQGEETISGRKLIIDFSPELHYTFRWKEKDIQEPFGFTREITTGELKKDSPDDAHAYFWRNKNGLQVEISKKNYGLTDCFFGHLIFGNKIDTSTLLNGHSPSNVLFPERLGEKDIHLHECHWGIEAIEKMVSPEIDQWWHFLEASDRVAMLVNLHLRNEISLDGCRAIIESLMVTEKLIDDIQWSASFLSSILDNLEDSEMYQCALLAMKRAHEKEFLVKDSGKMIFLKDLTENEK